MSKNEHKRIKSVVFISLLFNMVLSLMLGYVVCIKTDLYDKFLMKVGVKTCPVIDYRRFYQIHCLEGWANTFDKMNIESDIVFYGNSITYESDFQKYYPQLKICNLGCNGDNLDDLIFRSFIIESFHPKKIFILGGINGFVNISIEEFETKYSILVDSIKKRSPNAQLFLQSLLPVNVEMEIGSRYVSCQGKIKKANQIISSIAKATNSTFVDLYSEYQINDSLPRRYTRDGLHLFPEAYSIWAKVISPFLISSE